MSNLEQKFNEHYVEWKKTKYSSQIKKILVHPSYRAIIALGKEAIPLILKSIKEDDKDVCWDPALKEITGENHANMDATTFEEQNIDWLRWGQRNGYV